MLNELLLTRDVRAQRPSEPALLFTPQARYYSDAGGHHVVQVSKVVVGRP